MKHLYKILALLLLLCPLLTQAQDTCGANFTITNGNNAFTKTYTPQLIHSSFAFATQICWQFGDGHDTCFTAQPGSLVPPAPITHNYAQPGTYNVCVKITYDGGCVGEKCKPVPVALTNPNDSCSANYLAAQGISPSAWVFTPVPGHNNNKPVTRIDWNWDDGSQSTQFHTLPATHYYQVSGNYNVCETIHYEGGCISTVCKPLTVTIPDSCYADFNVTGGNNSLQKIFTALPAHNNNKPAVRICWNFGDGVITCDSAVAGIAPPLTQTHTYAAAGNYNACVTITYQGFCSSSECKSVTVSNPVADSCYADFSDTSINGAALTKKFTAFSYTTPPKPIKEVCWIFGDGRDTCITYDSVYTGSHFVYHSYLQAGIYNVCVKIKYYYSLCVAEKCRPVTVGQVNPVDSCRADFTILPAGSPLARTFSPLAWHNNNKPVTEVKWTFGDNSPPVITTTLINVTHTFPQGGNYNVCIRIKYNGGCISEKCKPLTITSPVPDSCTANFEVTGNNTAPLTRKFTAIPSSTPTRKVQEVCWRFGDNRDTCITYDTSYTGSYFVYHTYASYGTYTACVKIKYYGGCVAEKCKPVAILPTTPADSCQANFETLQAAAGSLSRTFVALPWHNLLKKPWKICWQFGDGRDTCIQYDSSYTGTYMVNHQYYNAGVYNVCVRIYYFGGCIADKCKSVTVGTITPADSCSANFEVISAGLSTLTRIFVAQPWHNNNKRPEKICWKFGDGRDTCINYNPAQTYNYTVTHTYAQPGIYNVCVKIKYQGGCVSEKCKPVTVGTVTPADSCLADFSVTSFNSTPFIKKYTALPWHNNNKRPEKICWIFGDGRDTCITYNAANPNNDYSVTHVYTNAGVYTVCVKIKYQGGCESQKCRTVTVGINTQPDSCRAAFASEAIQNNVLWQRFRAIPWHLGQKKPEKICWTFGDGRDTCITYNPAVPSLYLVNHLYNSPGTYTVCVKIWYQGGCIAQHCQPVAVIIPPCRALFTDSMISRFKVKFKGQAVTANANDPVISWAWTFGDGTSGAGQNVVHEYAQPGSYQVCLKIKTAGGCENTLCKTKVIDSTIRILQLAPNPVQNTLYITYYSYQNETAQIKIYNIFGVLVKSFSRPMVVGYNNFSTDVSTLTPGPYSLVVQTPTTLTSSVFFKQ
jgi:PKD repeat protein